MTQGRLDGGPSYLISHDDHLYHLNRSGKRCGRMVGIVATVRAGREKIVKVRALYVGRDREQIIVSKYNACPECVKSI